MKLYLLNVLFIFGLLARNSCGDDADEGTTPSDDGTVPVADDGAASENGTASDPDTPQISIIPEEPEGEAALEEEEEATSPANSAEVSSWIEHIKGEEDCICGRPRLVGGRVVGGELAKINELPWTVAIVMKRDHQPFCGATLICDRYVLTASHCFMNIFSPEQIQVHLMEEDFEVSDENVDPSLKIDVEEIIMHPKWNTKTLNNDITLLKLAEPVSIGNDGGVMTPACLPANNDHWFAGKEAIVAGWGATKYQNDVESKLRKLKVPILDQQECIAETRYGKSNKISDNMLCAGFLEGKKDACQGDSGGPLVIEEFGKYTLVGVVSFGYKCARPKAPGVYARVGRYADWIRENTKDCQYCRK